MINIKFRITNLTCDACVKLSVKALKKILGVSDVKIDQTTGSVDLSSDREISWEEIIGALKSVDKQAVK